MAVDAVHLVSMAVWLGGLFMLVPSCCAGRPRGARRDPADLVPLGDARRLRAAPRRIVQGLLEIGSLGALVSTTYGRLLLAKVGLFALVLRVAAISRHLVRTGIGAHRPSGLRRAVWVELVIAAVVLGVTSTLVHTTPARTASTGGGWAASSTPG